MLAGGAIAAAAAIAAAVWMRPSNDAPTAAASSRQNRVVISTFDNRTGDADLAPVGLMAADWIARGLAAAEVMEVAGTEADLASRGVTSAEGANPLAALAEIANARIVISGTYYKERDSLLLQADIRYADDPGRPVQSIGPVGALASAPLAGVELLRQRVVGGLALLVDSSLGPYAARSLAMPSFEAYRDFLGGEELYYRDPTAARDRYARAAQRDSNYHWPVLRLLNNAYDAGDRVELAHALIAARSLV